MARSTDLTTPPLRPAVFHILLAVSGQDLHGLGIADEVERTSGGALQLGPGTLYRSLAEMAEHHLVETLLQPVGTDPRRKYYRITREGRSLLGREAERLAKVVEEARSRDVLPATP